MYYERVNLYKSMYICGWLYVSQWLTEFESNKKLNPYYKSWFMINDSYHFHLLEIILIKWRNKQNKERMAIITKYECTNALSHPIIDCWKMIKSKMRIWMNQLAKSTISDPAPLRTQIVD